MDSLRAEREGREGGREAITQLEHDLELVVTISPGELEGGRKGERREVREGGREERREREEEDRKEGREEGEREREGREGVEGGG